MRPEELERFKQKLLTLKAEILGTGPAAIDPNRQDQTGKRDEDAEPLNEMHQSIASSRNRTRTADLKKIDDALLFIQDFPAEFGLCHECEEPIPTRRLEVMPYAQFCVACQSAREPGRGGVRKKLMDYK